MDLGNTTNRIFIVRSIIAISVSILQVKVLCVNSKIKFETEIENSKEFII